MTKIRHVWNVPTTKEKAASSWVERLKLTPMNAQTQPGWYKKLSRTVENENFMTQKMCPSTMNFMTNGFLVRNPADLFVKRVNEHDVSIDTEIDNNYHISNHPFQQFGEEYPFDNGFIPHSFKFESFYELVIDEPVTVMFMPCWWHPSYNDIRAFHGMLNINEPNKPTIYSINTKLRLPEIGEAYRIVADTPIAHMFFVNVLDAVVDEDLKPHSSPEGRIENAEQATAKFSKKDLNYLKSFVIGGKND